MKEALLAILDKNINQEQLVKDILKEIVLAEVDKYIASTPNKVDDIVFHEFKMYLEGKL